MKSRKNTEEELKEQFLDHVRMLVDYYAKESTKQTSRERLEGLAFSILVAIDGESATLPSFILAPLPHKDNNIAGELHDSFFTKEEDQ